MTLTQTFSKKVNTELKSEIQMATAENITAGEWIDKGATRQFVFAINDVYYYVYKQSILKVEEVDAIVNPTNASLGHSFGVSQHVAKAAGQTVIDQCENYRRDYRNVLVTENFVSSAGNLPYQGIIHAVGPVWKDYHGKLSDCAEDLYKTILNVLMKASSNGWKSVAIPAISSGQAGIPKKLCAEMYVKAFIEYPISCQIGVKEVHFVDTNEEIIDLVFKTYEATYDNPSLLAFQNAEKYTPPPSPRQSSTREPDQVKGRTMKDRKRSQYKPQDLLKSVTPPSGRSSTRPNQFGISKPGTPSGSYSFTYGNVQTFIYQASITTITGMDGIVNSTVGSLEHGCGVAKDIASAAGDGMVAECNAYTKTHGNVKVTEHFVSSGGNLPCKGIIHAVGPQWKYYKHNNNRQGCADDLRMTVVKVLQSARKKNWRKIAMTAMSSNHSGVPQDLCATEYIEGIKEFANQNTGSLVEIHFIDKDQKILDMVIDAHKNN